MQVAPRTTIISRMESWFSRLGQHRWLAVGLAFLVEAAILAALTLIPSFYALARFANPALLTFTAATPITITGDARTFSLFAKPASDCDKARHFFSRNGLSYEFTAAPGGPVVAATIGTTRAAGLAATAFTRDWLAAEPCAAETIKQDAFGRWLARIFRADGSDLSAALLAAGHATLFVLP